MSRNIEERGDKKNIHIHLIALMQQGLGYDLENKGICYGITAMAMQAILQGEEAFNTFKDRINQLNNYTPEELAEKVKETPKTKDVIDLLAFFDGIYLNARFKKNHQLLNEFKGARIQDVALSQTLTLPSSLQDKNSGQDQFLYKAHSFAGVYNADTLKTYLESIEEAVARYPNFKETICFSLGSSDHQILLAYTADQETHKRKWTLVDSNKLYDLKVEDPSHFSERIQAAFNEGNVLFSTEVFFKSASKEADCIVSAIKDNTKFQATHALNSEKLNKKDPKGIDISHMCARENCDETLNQCLKQTKHLNESVVSNKINYLLWVAIHHKSPNCVRLLINQGASLNHSKNQDGETPLTEAIKGGNLEIVKILVERGAKLDSKNNAGQTPLAVANSQGHREIANYLQETQHKNSLRNSAFFNIAAGVALGLAGFITAGISLVVGTTIPVSGPVGLAASVTLGGAAGSLLTSSVGLFAEAKGDIEMQRAIASNSRTYPMHTFIAPKASPHIEVQIFAIHAT